MRWGIRRYQNSDGSLTDAGRKHYGVGEARQYTDKEKKENLKRYNKFSNNGKIDPIFYETFSARNSQIIDDYVQAEKKRLEMLCEKGPAEIAKKATEYYLDTKEKAASDDEIDLEQAKDIYSHDQWDMDEAEYWLGKNDKEFNRVASEEIAKRRKVYEQWKEEVGNYTGETARSTNGMFFNASEKMFRDNVGKDQTAYWNDFYKSMNNALDQEKKKVTSRDIFSDSYKKSALQKAKDSGMYNIDFLEAVQNKPYMHADTPERKKMLLSEYKRFLNDPENYRAAGEDE